MIQMYDQTLYAFGFKDFQIFFLDYIDVFLIINTCTSGCDYVFIGHIIYN